MFVIGSRLHTSRYRKKRGTHIIGSCSSKNSSATAAVIQKPPGITDILLNDHLTLIASFLDVPTCLMLAVAFTASPSSPGWRNQNDMILSTASKSILSSLPTSVVLDMSDTESRRDITHAHRRIGRLARRIVNDDLFAMLTCIMNPSTKANLIGLKLTRCTNIMGSNGLSPLLSCNTLKKVDLSLDGKHERKFNGFNSTFSYCQVCGDNAPRSSLNKCEGQEKVLFCRLTNSHQGALYCNDCRKSCDLCSNLKLRCKECDDKCDDIFYCDRCEKGFCIKRIEAGEKGESDVKPGMCFECWDRSGSMLNSYCSKDCHDKSVIFSDDHSSFDLEYQTPRCSKRWPLTDPYNAFG